MPGIKPSVVLVRPRNPLNLGACARAMANFGLTDLRVVSPHPPVWEKALRSAKGAERLLRKARVFPGLPEAVADRSLVLATSSLKARVPELEVRALPGLRLRRRAALVFGPEKHGLTLRDLAHCDAIVRIPTVPGCPSMNLAQAVVVCCYELAGKGGKGGAWPEAERIPFAVLERLVSRSERGLAKVGYRPKLTPEKRRARVRRVLRRRGVLPGEAGMLFEILRRVLD